MKSTTQYVLSALTAFIIAGGGSILTVIGAGYALNDRAYIIAVTIGLMGASKDIRSLMRMPPIEPSGTAFISKPTEEKKP